MGQRLSCRATHENGLLGAIRFGELETVLSLLETDPSLIRQTSPHNRDSALHFAAAHGHIEILSLLLERSANPDEANGKKQTPLVLAAMHGKTSCVEKLVEVGANILLFDSVGRRTCLHYAAYYGHPECLKAILSAARSSPIAVSWGYARFVNVRDGKGATALHVAARGRQVECVRVLLENGGLVSASTWFPGSTPLHLAARGGSLECIRELLAWGADRLHTDSSGRIPYVVALKHRHGRCAALLNPSAAEPLVWPSPLKFISELNEEAKTLLEEALMKANREREKGISPVAEFDDASVDGCDAAGVCSICFEAACTIQVEECGHRMCARCTLALCCHKKPDPATASLTPPVCPFCRSGIARLVVATAVSSFRGLVTDAVGSFRRMGGGRSSGRIAAEEDWTDKLMVVEGEI